MIKTLKRDEEGRLWDTLLHQQVSLCCFNKDPELNYLTVTFEAMICPLDIKVPLTMTRVPVPTEPFP
jgi:hypothetical protein